MAPAQPLLRAIGATLALVVAVGPAFAGAWPREPGEVFLSLRTDAELAPDAGGTSLSVYGEYGVTRRVTLVAQASNDDAPWTATRTGSSVRFALGRLDATHRFAVSLGASTPPTLMGAMTDARLEAALHYGRGFESRWGGGWVTATAKVFLERDEAEPITDLYGLVGVRPREGWMTMLSLGRYEDAQGAYYKLSPSVGYEVRPEVWLVPSVTQELTKARSTSLGLSIWFTF